MRWRYDESGSSQAVQIELGYRVRLASWYLWMHFEDEGAS